MKTEKPSHLSKVTQQSSGTRAGSRHPSAQQDSDSAEGCFLKNYLLIFGCAGSSLLHAGSSLVGMSRGSSPAAVPGLLIVASLVAEHGLQGVRAQ